MGTDGFGPKGLSASIFYHLSSNSRTANRIKCPYQPLQSHQNPSVCFADIIPAGPQEEGALVCSKGTNLGPARGSYAGPSPLRKGDYSIAAPPPLES